MLLDELKKLVCTICPICSLSVRTPRELDSLWFDEVCSKLENSLKSSIVIIRIFFDWRVSLMLLRQSQRFLMAKLVWRLKIDSNPWRFSMAILWTNISLSTWESLAKAWIALVLLMTSVLNTIEFA